MSSNDNSSPENEHFVERTTRKRKRIPLSCNLCRARKLKCNRESPCQNCIARNEAQACEYARGAPPGESAKGVSNGHRQNVAVSPQDEMQARIEKLESLITKLIQEKANQSILDGSVSDLSVLKSNGKATGTNGDGPIKLEEMQDSLGVMHIDQGKTVYHSGTHWDVVLRDIAALKATWKDFRDQDKIEDLFDSPEEVGICGPTFLSGIPTPSKAELLASMPPKESVDKLVERFFSVHDPAVPARYVLHKPSFMKHYHNYWADFQNCPNTWLGLLYSMLSIVMQSYHLNSLEPTEYRGISATLSDTYRTRSGQCLLLVDVTDPPPYLLEALIVQAMGEYLRGGGKVLWLMCGNVGRLAIQMGYHRDPAPYKDFTPFQMEMRRRLWAFVVEMDQIFSFHAGLPGFYRPEESDTADPLNLFDWELTEDLTALPESRPSNQDTDMTYLLGKLNIGRVVGRITEQINSVRPHSYAEVLALDSSLREARTRTTLGPPGTFADIRPAISRSVYLDRVQFELLYHKGVCALHRKFLALARVDQKYIYSRTVCVESCMELLKMQRVMHSDAKSTDDMPVLKWYRFAVTCQDFVMAATILCLDLHHEASQVKQNGAGERPERRREMMLSLEAACLIWKDVLGLAPDAGRILRILTVMLDDLKKSFTESSVVQQRPSGFGIPATFESPIPMMNNPTSAPESIPSANTDPSSGSWAFSSSDGTPATNQTSLDASLVADDDIMAGFNWDAWDSYIMGESFGDAYEGSLGAAEGIF